MCKKNYLLLQQRKVAEQQSWEQKAQIMAAGIIYKQNLLDTTTGKEREEQRACSLCSSLQAHDSVVISCLSVSHYLNTCQGISICLLKHLHLVQVKRSLYYS